MYKPDKNSTEHAGTTNKDVEHWMNIELLPCSNKKPNKIFRSRKQLKDNMTATVVSNHSF